MNSLRLRLVGFTLLAVGLVWLLTAVMVWRQAHHELDELFDSLPAAVRADLEHEHHEVVEEIAEHMAKPVLIAFPILALLLAVAVSLALRPLHRLADEVAARAPEHLQPLSAAGAPAEVAPLIARLNQLFVAIGRALDNERRFTADAAHELRTPLAAIKTQAQVALGAQVEGEREHALRQIVAGCDRATHLVEQLLTLARLDAPQGATFTEIDLRMLAAEVLADAADLALRRGSQLALAEGGAVPVQGDGVLLRVLLRNLVDNALRHTPPGSEIEIWIDATGPALVVSDNGPGLDADERRAVLQRFHRTPGSSSDGSGLGLSIVARIAELHCARFSLEPAPGGGSAAWLRFDTNIPH